MLLDVRGLNVEFRHERGWSRVVHEVSFTLEGGHTLGIVGESGSGKSVTALSVMGLLPQRVGRVCGGSILFSPEGTKQHFLAGGKEAYPAHLRGRELSMIFQEPMTSLNPVMRCGKQVTEVLRLHEGYSPAEAKERTLELFEEVKLPRLKEIFRSYPHEISGGQKQRVMIAMAMACRPALLIADEPTTALDVTVQKAILALLRELQEKHRLGIIFISHDLGVVARLAHELAVMYRGEIVEAGLASDIFRNPRHPYTRGLLACRPPLDVRLKSLPTLAEFMNGTTNDSGITGDIVSRAESKARLDSLYGQEPLLQVTHLSTWFPKHKDMWGRAMDYMKAVEEVSIEVFPGETLGLVGESGCGKTTLGRTMLRLVKATGGDILYKGKSIFGLDKSERNALRKQMQIIFQDPYSSLNPRLTAGECILEPMRVHHLHGNDHVRKEKVMDLLTRTGLEEQHYYRYPHEFSGGQRQRICIARALAVEPEFVVCDESVSALDISMQAQVLNLLNQLKQEFGLTYIFISHDLGVVRYMSDRIVVMKDGRIVEFGDADEVCSNPKTSYTQQLIAAVPGITGSEKGY